MISLIAAIGKNGELGKDNHLLWPLKTDLKYFKNVTSNHKVIMGLNTYLSIGKPLPNRTNIILTTHPELINNDDVTIYNDINDLINNISNQNEECFIIGGASMYKYFYDLADKMYLTEIDLEDKDADTYFPKFNKEEWNKTIIANNIENDIRFNFVVYERVQK